MMIQNAYKIVLFYVIVVMLRYRVVLSGKASAMLKRNSLVHANCGQFIKGHTVVLIT